MSKFNLTILQRFYWFILIFNLKVTVCSKLALEKNKNKCLEKLAANVFIR